MIAKFEYRFAAVALFGALVGCGHRDAPTAASETIEPSECRAYEAVYRACGTKLGDTGAAVLSAHADAMRTSLRAPKDDTAAQKRVAAACSLATQHVQAACR